MEGEVQSRKEGRGPRRLNFFSGLVGAFLVILSTNLKGLGEAEKNSVEEEGSDGTEDAPAPVWAYQSTGGPTLSQSNQSPPSLLAIMQQMTQNMANL
ncbi:hypothetical protein O181_039281 [Austropuccinia psidii MF-1]|uniref:Uncharacterized protein n=1 Tax=Austropuccinia psidii MF-1 TaxID=1389203 RepID=A0A9Q3DFL9_9BASI|nr:hypothetical protein [Austropuccinia psidii MF-1]